jgi:predicted DNA-binding transcriptional regulator AlpA
MTPTPKNNGTAAPDLDRLLSVKQVCVLLSVSDRGLRRWVQANLVPPPDVRIGRNLRWRASTIRRIVDGVQSETMR